MEYQENGLGSNYKPKFISCYEDFQGPQKNTTTNTLAQCGTITPVTHMN